MPAVLRSLLPIVAALAMLVQPVTTWAAAGVTGAVSCCCPEPATCECHDHHGDRHDAPRLKRCGDGAVELVAPVGLVATPPAPAPVLIAPRTLVPPTVVVAAIPEDRTDRPEPPPF